MPPSPAAALTDAGGGWPARRRTAQRDRGSCGVPVARRGVRAEEARDSDDFTEFDGHVAAAGPVLDPSRTAGCLGDDAGGCREVPVPLLPAAGPRREADRGGRADADAWLDPLTKGSELHALFARIMRALREAKREADREERPRRLRAWGEERLDQLRAEMPPPSDEVYARESREFLDDLDAFLTAECEGRHGGIPSASRWRSASAGRGEGEPLASAEPLVLDLGGKRRLALHGRIDRINRLGPASTK